MKADTKSVPLISKLIFFKIKKYIADDNNDVWLNHYIWEAKFGVLQRRWVNTACITAYMRINKIL